jgi:flagella basal body P-ring formation protein FlgA
MKVLNRSRNLLFSPSPAFHLAVSALLATVGSSFSWASEPVQRAEEMVTISLRSQTLVRGREVTIGDVADLAPAQTPLAEEVKKIVVSRTPWPGYTQRVTPDILQMALRGRIADLSRVSLAGAAECAVNAAAVKISGDIFLEAARKHILRQLPWSPEEIRITCAETAHDRYVPVGTGEGPVLEITTANQEIQRGVIRLKLEVRVDQEPVFHTLLSFQVQTFQNVVVASENLSRGTILSPENTTLERREITDLSFNFFTEPQKVYGKLAARNLRSGTTLTSSLIEASPVITPKSLITIVYENAGLRISMKGTAHEAGAPGNMIRVQSLENRKILFAKVIDSQTVLVAGQ